MKKRIYILFSLLIILAACEKNPYEKYEGTYTGYIIVENNEQLPLNGSIDDEGNCDFTSQLFSNTPSSYSLTGSVNEDGYISLKDVLEENAQLDIYLEGSINSNGSCNGTWESFLYLNGVIQDGGTWVMSKD